MRQFAASLRVFLTRDSHMTQTTSWSLPGGGGHVPPRPPEVSGPKTERNGEPTERKSIETEM